MATVLDNHNDDINLVLPGIGLNHGSMVPAYPGSWLAGPHYSRGHCTCNRYFLCGFTELEGVQLESTNLVFQTKMFKLAFLTIFVLGSALATPVPQKAEEGKFVKVSFIPYSIRF